MNDESNVSQSHNVTLDRYRNPTFSKEETEALVRLVEKYKAIILNKSTVTAINHAKEAAWIKIAEVFNSQGFKHTRRPDCLKTKWDNLKRHAKKVSNNLMDPKYDEFSDLTNPVVSLLCEAEMSSSMSEVPQDIKEELKQAMNEQKMDTSKTKSDIFNKQESDNSDGDLELRKMRSLNFSPQESSILLKCVREEQKFVFSKQSTKNALQSKRRAWSRITEAFNKRSPHKRSTIALQTKFCNMKRNVKHRFFKKYHTNKNHERLVEEDIKEEPHFLSKSNSDVEQEDNNDDDSDDAVDDLLLDTTTKNPADDAPDPISTGLGSESGPDGDYELRRNRSLNFTPHEVSTFLQCVRDEHKYIFCKDNTARAIHQKNKAWTRITEAFNRQTGQERSTRVLKTKFTNLKRNSRFGRIYYRRSHKNNRHEKLIAENSKDIKTEPRSEYRSDSDNDNDEAEDEDCVNEVLADSVSNPSPEPAPDPLSTVLSSDSGLGSTSFIGAYNFGNNEVTKLKMELLKYRLENEKLERQRIQEAIRAEAAARESLAIERCLRLRAARLEAVAAELKLPAAHPALQYTFEESPAEQYMNQYH